MTVSLLYMVCVYVMIYVYLRESVCIQPDRARI